MRSWLAGVVALLLLIAPAAPSFAYYLSGSGLISYLGTDTYRVSMETHFVFSDIYAELGVPHENNGFPIGIYPFSGSFEALMGQFGTPFNLSYDSGLIDSGQGYLNYYGGLPTFDVVFNPSVSRAMFSVWASRDFLTVEFHPTYDAHNLATAYGSAAFFCDLPTEIGESTQILPTPENASWSMLCVGLGMLGLVGRKRITRRIFH